MRTVTFPRLDGHWSPITAAKHLKRGKPLALTFDDVPVVAFRDEAGRARALVDRCPHRSVKLSIGTLPGDGTIQCAFHGWRYGGEGACRHVPLNPDAKLTTVHAQALACEESEGLLWLFAGAAEAAPPLTPPPPLGEGWFDSVALDAVQGDHGGEQKRHVADGCAAGVFALGKVMAEPPQRDRGDYRKRQTEDQPDA